MKIILRVLVVLFVGWVIIDVLVGIASRQGSSAPTQRVVAPEFTTHLNDTIALTHSVFATRTSDDAARVGELLRAGDKSALRTMALQGRLTLIKKGTTVTLTDRDILKCVEAFRARGNPDTQYAAIGQIY